MIIRGIRTINKNLTRLTTMSIICLLVSSCSDNVPLTVDKSAINQNNSDVAKQIQEDEENSSSTPKAKIVPEKKYYNGQLYTDNYSWMKDKNNPDFINYLAQENKYTDSFLEKKAPIQQQLYGEMIDRVNSEDVSLPEKNGNYYYYQKKVEGKQYPLYCRKYKSLYEREEIILDLNQFSEGRNISFPGDIKVSPDNKYLAFSIDKEGNESYTVYIKNLQNQEVLAQEIKNTYGNIEWTNDSLYIYYTVLNSSLRPYKIFKHRVNTNVSSDVLIYSEKDPAYSINISKTDSKAFILINSESISSNESWYLGAKDNKGKFKLFQKRKTGIKYYIQHNGGKFYILTNSNAKRYKVMAVNVLEQYRKVSWEELLPTSYTATLNSFQALKNHIVVFFRENGQAKVKVINLKTNKKYNVEFSEPSYSVKPINISDYNSDIFKFSYSSFITPQSIYEYDLIKKSRKIAKEEKIRNYNPYNYQTEKINVTSRDGKRIPVSLIYRRDFIRNASSPMLINAYGAYGESNDPKFESDKLSLLDKGYVYAIANVRGGGELGIDWYESGKLLDKKNSFNDLIDCAEAMVYQGYADRNKISLTGKGAGGLLVAAAINLRPDLFNKVILEDPFVDVLNTMNDATLPLTVDEYNEWGNPTYSRYYDYIKSYSPYDNIVNQKYPEIFITAGINNSVVGVWESAKYTAKMRAIAKNQNIIFKTYTDSGHKGKIGEYDSLKRKALEYSFLLGN